jgi:hypothetical protein
MDWPRSALLRRLAAEASGVWASVASEAGSLWEAVSAGEMSRAAPRERLRRHCQDCACETPHEAFDEMGLGWYAQVWRCRRCGRQAIRVWAFGAW